MKTQLSQRLPTELETRTIGGKARNLLDLQLAGFRVPDFVCSPSDTKAAIDLLGTPLVVRSSATAEDGHQASFAGQFQSFLDLNTMHEVEDAITDCMDSLDAPSVAEYCEANGIEQESLRMGVIVQRMIRPELAGVAFTVNPMTGREEVVIEACEGLGDALLQGSASPLPADHALLTKYRPAIEKTARAVQQHFGEPQDIEFAIEEGELFLLQARPITRIHSSGEEGEWTNADFRDGGVSCSVCTPLMWSLYDHVWQDALNGFLRDIKLLGKREDDFQAGRMFYGRPYWNVGKVKDCMAKLPGFVEKDFDADLQIRVDPNSEGRVTPVTPLGVLRALPTVLAVPAMWKRQARFDHDFLDGGFEKLVSRFEDKIKDPTESFGQLIEEAFTVTELNYFRTIFCASLAKLDFAEAFPEATSTALIGGIPDIRHLEPVRAMREMKARGEKDLSLLMKRFRHHSRNELDLRAPRWDEDPEWIEQMWDNLPPDSGDRPKAAYTEALSRELQCLPKRQHRRFLKKLNRLRHFLWLREEMRDLSTQMYYLIRKHVLAIAEERNLGDDVFFMTWKEIVAMDCSSIAAARATFESYRNFKAPNEIGRPFTANIEAASSGEFTGIAASPGVTQGPVAIARDVTEAMGAPAGSILVCPFTDPGWTSVLGKVAAVVTENGGQLSHAAVICREFGIPAVLGVGDATLRLKDGHFVTVDGDHGKIITH